MAIATETKTYTAEEYLTFEIEADIRHEFRNGEIKPMTGGTPAHIEMTRMFVFLLTTALCRKPLSIFVTDQRSIETKQRINWLCD